MTARPVAPVIPAASRGRLRQASLVRVGRCRWPARRSAGRGQNAPVPRPQHGHGITGPVPRPAQPQVDQARVIARRLAAAGKPVSRRALRSAGVTGSNETLNALARVISAELAGCADSG